MLRNGVFRFVGLYFLFSFCIDGVCGVEQSSNGAVSSQSAGPSSSSSMPSSSEPQSSAIASNSASSPPDTTKSSKTFITELSTETLFSAVFTQAPNATGIAEARRCWNDITFWRNSSAAWYNANIANRTWSIGPAITSDIVAWSSSTTIYPMNASAYTLCDGTPRVNERPITHHFSGNSTTYWTWMSTQTPQFRSQPCTPDPEVCRMWYYDSNVKKMDDQELIRQCGNPAHQGAPCLIGGGPVQLVYFPVTTKNGNLCGKTGSTISKAPGAGGPYVVTTLGHTFTSGSVYLSFKSLFASYDGFWDRIGPTFSDFIIPLPSSAISTQCGGFGNAHGPGTALNYADLNWPVPASAYSCQDRCSVTLTSSCSFCSWYTKPNPPECNTIWRDIDPVLAVPTQVREMVPEWSTCSFWDYAIPNFWFDPPIALHEVDAEPTPTWNSKPLSTAAETKASVQDPLPKNTGTTNGPDPVQTGTANDPKSTVNSPSSTIVQHTSPDPQSPEHTEALTTGRPEMPALSILAGALSSGISETDPAMKTMISKAHSIANSILRPHKPQETEDPDQTSAPAPDPLFTGAIVTVSGRQLTAVQSSGHIIVGSQTLRPGQATTISGVTISADSSRVVIGSQTAALTAIPSSTAESYTSISFAPIHDPGQHISEGVTVVSAGSVTLTESSLGSKAVVVNGTTLSLGGPKATISGQVITEGSSGLVWLSPVASGRSQTSLPLVVTGSDSRTSATQSKTGAGEPSSTSTSGGCGSIVRPWRMCVVLALLVAMAV